MGVTATFCQVCALPVNHDHYVPEGGMFRIYRGPVDRNGEPLVPFGPEHDWLLQAVALRLSDGDEPVVVEGPCHDGSFEAEDGDGAFVWDGLDERAALHRVCWELAGRPDTFEPLEDLPVDPAIEPFREQLFEFAGFIEAGHGWMLVDPRGDGPDARRSRERIARLLARGA